jgi:hypothetical protein
MGVSVESNGGSASVSPLRDNVVVRLGLYYLAVFALFAGLAELFPSIAEYATLERLRVVGGAQDLLGGEGGAAIDNVYGTEALLRLDRTVPVVASMLGALALSLPVAWVYTWTHPNEKTMKAVARALLMLPLAIAFVVFLVKGSLALAFSLAGIVAAVRFRTSLSDPGDAVFMFVGIGIGLSAGVQLLSVAFLASVIFTSVTLAMWRTRFAEDPPRLEGLRLCPAEMVGSHPSFDPTTGARRKSNGEGSETVFSVQSTDPGQVARLTELVFGRYAKEWRLNRVTDGEGGSWLLEFSVRLKKGVHPATVEEAIRGSGGQPIVRVESVSR